MNETQGGPATGTRSKKISEKSDTRRNLQASTEKAQEISKQQKFFSSYFKNVRVDRPYSSDTEIVNTEKLKKRSVSGKIYKTLYRIPPLQNQQKAMSDNDYTAKQSVNAIENAEGAEYKEPTQVQKSSERVHKEFQKENTSIEVGAKEVTMEVLNPCTAGATKVTNAISTSGSTVTYEQPIVFTTEASLNTGCTMTTTTTINAGGIMATQLYSQNQSKEKMATTTVVNTTGSAVGSAVGSVPLPADSASTTNATVLAMFNAINDKLNGMQADMRAVKATHGDINQQIVGIQFDQEDDHEELVSQKKDLHQCRDRVDILSDLIIRYEERMQELESKCERLQAKNMKGEIIIFGLKDTKASCSNIAQGFFTTQMEMEASPNILYAYWKGKSEYKPMVVKFVNPASVGTVYSKVANLKGKKNHLDRAYRIEDHLPERMAEEQQRNRQIVAQNKKLDTGNQLTMKYSHGKLMVAGETYRKKIQVPKAKDLINIEPEHTANYKEIPVAYSTEASEADSVFQAYAMNVGNLDQVRNNIIHMRHKCPTATHLCVAYRLSGLNKAYDEDFLDDGEHSMGRRMLNTLIDKELSDTMIVLSRKYGGTHIGAKRFQIAQNLIENALDMLQKGITIKSTLPLRCLLEPQKKRRGRNKKPHLHQSSIRGGFQASSRLFSNLRTTNQFRQLDLDSPCFDSETSETYKSVNGFDTNVDDWSKCYPAQQPQENWDEPLQPGLNYGAAQEKNLETIGACASNICPQ